MTFVSAFGNSTGDPLHMPFNLPESYSAYCTDTAVRTAVDHILTSRGTNKSLAIPSDLKWCDLRAFHRAVLSAHQIQCDYAVHLIDLWDAVWQPTLAACDLNSKARSTHDTQEWSGERFDTCTLWDGGWFSRVFDVVDTDFEIYMGVRDDTEQVMLSFAIWGTDDKDHTTGQDFGDDWPEEAMEDGFTYTRNNLARIQEDGSVDLVPLHKAAAIALTAVATR